MNLKLNLQSQGRNKLNQLESDRNQPILQSTQQIQQPLLQNFQGGDRSSQQVNGHLKSNLLQVQLHSPKNNLNAAQQIQIGMINQGILPAQQRNFGTARIQLKFQSSQSARNNQNTQGVSTSQNNQKFMEGYYSKESLNQNEQNLENQNKTPERLAVQDQQQQMVDKNRQISARATFSSNKRPRFRFVSNFRNQVPQNYAFTQKNGGQTQASGQMSGQVTQAALSPETSTNRGQSNGFVNSALNTNRNAFNNLSRQYPIRSARNQNNSNNLNNLGGSQQNDQNRQVRFSESIESNQSQKNNDIQKIKLKFSNNQLDVKTNSNNLMQQGVSTQKINQDKQYLHQSPKTSHNILLQHNEGVLSTANFNGNLQNQNQQNKIKISRRLLSNNFSGRNQNQDQFYISQRMTSQQTGQPGIISARIPQNNICEPSPNAIVPQLKSDLRSNNQNVFKNSGPIGLIKNLNGGPVAGQIIKEMAQTGQNFSQNLSDDLLADMENHQNKLKQTQVQFQSQRTKQQEQVNPQFTPRSQVDQSDPTKKNVSSNIMGIQSNVIVKKRNLNKIIQRVQLYDQQAQNIEKALTQRGEPLVSQTYHRRNAGNLAVDGGSISQSNHLSFQLDPSREGVAPEFQRNEGKNSIENNKQFKQVVKIQSRFDVNRDIQNDKLEQQQALQPVKQGNQQNQQQQQQLLQNQLQQHSAPHLKNNLDKKVINVKSPRVQNRNNNKFLSQTGKGIGSQEDLAQADFHKKFEAIVSPVELSAEDNGDNQLHDQSLKKNQQANQIIPHKNKETEMIGPTQPNMQPNGGPIAQNSALQTERGRAQRTQLNYAKSLNEKQLNWRQTLLKRQQIQQKQQDVLLQQVQANKKRQNNFKLSKDAINNKFDNNQLQHQPTGQNNIMAKGTQIFKKSDGIGAGEAQQQNVQIVGHSPAIISQLNYQNPRNQYHRNSKRNFRYLKQANGGQQQHPTQQYFQNNGVKRDGSGQNFNQGAAGQPGGNANGPQHAGELENQQFRLKQNFMNQQHHSKVKLMQKQHQQEMPRADQMLIGQPPNLEAPPSGIKEEDDKQQDQTLDLEEDLANLQNNIFKGSIVSTQFYHEQDLFVQTDDRGNQFFTNEVHSDINSEEPEVQIEFSPRERNQPHRRGQEPIGEQEDEGSLVFTGTGSIPRTSGRYLCAIEQSPQHRVPPNGSALPHQRQHQGIKKRNSQKISQNFNLVRMSSETNLHQVEKMNEKQTKPSAAQKQHTVKFMKKNGLKSGTQSRPQEEVEDADQSPRAERPQEFKMQAVNVKGQNSAIDNKQAHQQQQPKQLRLLSHFKSQSSKNLYKLLRQFDDFQGPDNQCDQEQEANRGGAAAGGARLTGNFQEPSMSNQNILDDFDEISEIKKNADDDDNSRLYQEGGMLLHHNHQNATLEVKRVFQPERAASLVNQYQDNLQGAQGGMSIGSKSKSRSNGNGQAHQPNGGSIQHNGGLLGPNTASLQSQIQQTLPSRFNKLQTVQNNHVEIGIKPREQGGGKRSMQMIEPISFHMPSGPVSPEKIKVDHQDVGGNGALGVSGAALKGTKMAGTLTLTTGLKDPNAGRQRNLLPSSDDIENSQKPGDKDMLKSNAEGNKLQFYR